LTAAYNFTGTFVESTLSSPFQIARAAITHLAVSIGSTHAGQNISSDTACTHSTQTGPSHATQRDSVSIKYV
jgi:hypothetical protein